ncbi:histidine phosphatase family protein [Limnohabitans sp. Rim8]|uniref:histidine phosphatase family protein n=1 Tax=Limnohabitans sp. Rim8 TaxID=1100718 RepID=UPI002636FDA8|nr:histidine phosphatase family protein [Limnohabitans sp. Rim8]
MHLFRGKIVEFLGLILLLSTSFSQAQEQLLIEKLQQGGFNIFIRHAITPGKDPVKFNPPTERPHDCSSGSRQLNDEGRAQSRRIGQRIKALNIPIGEVYASSFCRCEETAKLAFDRFTSTDWLVVRPGVFKPDLDRALRSVPTQGFFNKAPSGKNNVYVGHGVTFTQGVLSTDFGLSEARIFLEEGEAAVFEPGDKPRILGKIRFY